MGLRLPDQALFFKVTFLPRERVQGIIQYFVSAYYSAAVLVPDALEILEDVDIGR